VLRLAVAALAVGSFFVLGGRDVQACRIPCACLDADGGGTENDLVCCGAEELDLADALGEQQACGVLRVASPTVPFAEPIVEIAGRLSSKGARGCGCLDVDQDGTAEAVETVPQGEDCARTAAAACLAGHEPPSQQCATIVFDEPSCENG
jgi:hypothetical protein